MKTWSQFKSELVSEAIVPKNHNYGFMGTAKDPHKMLDQAIDHVKKASKTVPHFKMSDETIGHYLDSVGGRHLADHMNYNSHPDEIHKAVSRSLKEFSKTYDPNMFESFNDDGSVLAESDPHLSAVHAAAFSTAGKAAAAKRLAAAQKAREEYLAKKAGKTVDTSPKVMPTPSVKDVPKKHGILHTNQAKSMEHWSKVRKILDKPLPAKVASEKLAPHTDDARLHADLNHFAKSNPDVDTRPLVKKHLERIRKTG